MSNQEFTFEALSYVVINNTEIDMTVFLAPPNMYDIDLLIKKDIVLKYRGIQYYVDHLGIDPINRKFAYLKHLWEHPQTLKF